ncbi:hypothetical protein MTO96_000043 [Rhipicephalus appendiculatus]
MWLVYNFPAAAFRRVSLLALQISLAPAYPRTDLWFRLRWQDRRQLKCTLSTVVDEATLLDVLGPLKSRSMMCWSFPSSIRAPSPTLGRLSLEFWKSAKGSLCSQSPACRSHKQATE